MNTQHINIDIVPGGIPTFINVSQYDAGSRTLELDLFSSLGSLVIPAGATAGIRGTKPDGNGFSYDASISENTIICDVTKQMTAVAGKVRCEVVIESGDMELASANFIIQVERAALDKDTLVSGSEIRELVDIIDRTDEIIAAAHLADESCQEVAENTEAVLAAKAATDEALASVLEKEKWIATVTTNADTIAKQALEKAGNTENEVAEFQNQLDAMLRTDNQLTLSMEAKIDGAYVDSGYLYLTSNGEVVAGPLGPFSGTGGGGGGTGGNNASLSVTNTTGWLSKTRALMASRLSSSGVMVKKVSSLENITSTTTKARRKSSDLSMAMSPGKSGTTPQTVSFGNRMITRVRTGSMTLRAAIRMATRTRPIWRHSPLGSNPQISPQQPAMRWQAAQPMMAQPTPMIPQRIVWQSLRTRSIPTWKRPPFFFITCLRSCFSWWTPVLRMPSRL